MVAGYVVAFCTLGALACTYLHEDLQLTMQVLFVCVAFTSVAMLYFYKFRENKLLEELNAGGVDRTLFREYKKEELAVTLGRLHHQENKSTAAQISVLNYLREESHSDTLFAMELFKLGAISSLFGNLKSQNIDPKSLLLTLELLNELLSNKEVKSKLTTKVQELWTTTDAAMHWLISLLATLQKELRLDENVLQISSLVSQGGVDLPTLLLGGAVAFPAGESLTSRSDQLAVLVGKSLVTLGLLFSDDCVDAQSRATDRGGVSVLLAALNIALAMCSTTYTSQGIGAGMSGKGGAKNKTDILVTPELRVLRLKQSALVCKWSCWCLFNLSLNHPPSKAVLFHSSGMRTVVDALKLHPDSPHVHRQGLALLFNLISPDGYAKYSHAHARQMLMANGIVEVIEHVKVAFKKEKDVVATSRAILNILAVDYS